MSDKQPEHAVAEALRKVARRIDEQLGDGVRPWKIDAEDLLQTLVSVADELDPPLSQPEPKLR
jgi:hypothetical protein